MHKIDKFRQQESELLNNKLENYIKQKEKK